MKSSIATADLFISYRRTQQTEVQQAVSQLEAAGIRCYLDTRAIHPLVSFPDELQQAIAQAKAVLVWWSHDYAASDFCLQELTLGWQYARTQTSETGERLWLVNPETSAEHIFAGELSSQNYLTPATLVQPEQINELKNQLNKLSPLSKVGTEESQMGPQYGGRFDHVSQHFTGRQNELWRLHSLLHPAKISQSKRHVMIHTHGMAGIGKTELARAYVDRFAAAYPGGVFWLSLAALDDPLLTVDLNNMQRVWLDAVQKALAQAGQSGFYHKADGNLLSAEELYTRFGNDGPWQGKPVLWLLDNVPALNPRQYQQLQQWLQAPIQSAHTLITTRYSGALAGFASVEIAPLSDTAALQLLYSYKKFSDEQRPLAAQLVAITGAHTKALVLLGEYLAHNNYADVVNKLQKEQSVPAIDAIARAMQPLLGEKAKGIVATYALSIRNLSKEAHQILALACQCEGNSPIPAQLLQQAAAKLFQLSDSEVTVAFTELANASLMRRNKAIMPDNQEPDTLELHPLTIAAGWLLLQDSPTAPPAADELQHCLMQWVWTQFDQVEDHRTHPRIQPYLALAHFLPHQHLTDVACALRNRLGMFYFYTGLFQQAAAVNSSNLTFFSDKLGVGHPHTLNSKNNLASTLLKQGDLTGAKMLQQAVLEAWERLLGTDHPNTLVSKNNLASTLQAQGDLTSAKALLQAVLDVQERLLGTEHLSTLASKNNLALTLEKQGDLTAAKALQQAVLAVQERLRGAEHPNTLSSKNNLASTLLAQGDLTGAKALQQAVLEARERLQGAEHPDTLASKNNLASTLLAQGDLTGAKALQQAVLETLDRLMGAEHPNTLVSKNNLASTLQMQGDFTAAKALQQAVLEARDRRLGADHPNTLASKNNLARTLWELQEYLAAIALMQQAADGLQMKLGPQHPHTINTLHNLAIMQKQLDNLI